MMILLSLPLGNEAPKVQMPRWNDTTSTIHHSTCTNTATADACMHTEQQHWTCFNNTVTVAITEHGMQHSNITSRCCRNFSCAIRSQTLLTTLSFFGPALPSCSINLTFKLLGSVGIFVFGKVLIVSKSHQLR